MMSLKVALLLSCVLTYTNSQLIGLPTTQEQREASTVNSFRRSTGEKQKSSASDNQRPSAADSQTPWGSDNQRPLQSDSERPFSPDNQRPSYLSSQRPSFLSSIYNNNPGSSAASPFGSSNSYRPERPDRPQSSRFPSTQNSNNEQATRPQDYRPQYRPEYEDFRRPQRPVFFEPTYQKPAGYAPIIQFAWRLFSNAALGDQNYVSCPLSPQLLLSYLVSGSEGETQRQLISSVGYNSPAELTRLIQSMLRSGENRQLQIATAFFVSDRTQLFPIFRRTATENDVEILHTDFYNPDGFSTQYNQWVRSKTKSNSRPSRITLPANTKMVMSSAVYFKGDWIFKFDPAQTGEFYYAPGFSMPAEMMTLRRKLQYGTVGNARWISIPYNSSDAMVVILPEENIRIDDFIRNLNINEVFDGLNQDNFANVTLTMPKFKIDSKSSLVEPLQRMGMTRIFDSNSEITKLAQGEQLQVANALQDASMEINEHGSIATSLTTFTVVALSFTPPVPDIEMFVNRPFIAMIIDRKNNFPFFVAKVMTPQ